MKIHDLIVTFGILMKSNARFQQQLCFQKINFQNQNILKFYNQDIVFCTNFRKSNNDFIFIPHKIM